jgi:hypothetical protein
MSPVLAAALSQSRSCHPEAAESLARERLPTKDLCTSRRGRVRRIALSRFVEGQGLSRAAKPSIRLRPRGEPTLSSCSSQARSKLSQPSQGARTAGPSAGDVSAVARSVPIARPTCRKPRDVGRAGIKACALGDSVNQLYFPAKELSGHA